MKADILNHYRQLLGRAVSLTNIDCPEIQNLEKIIEEENLMEKLDKISWEELFNEINDNSDCFTYTAFWAHYQRQLQYAIDELYSQFPEDYDFMDEKQPLYQYFFNRDDADNYGCMICLIRLLDKKAKELREHL